MFDVSLLSSRETPTIPYHVLVEVFSFPRLRTSFRPGHRNAPLSFISPFCESNFLGYIYLISTKGLTFDVYQSLK